jgi:hypothetical protein
MQGNVKIAQKTKHQTVQVEHVRNVQQAKHQLQDQHAQIAQREKLQLKVLTVLLVVMARHLLLEGLVLLIA